jgi:hypothetical protein
MCEEPVAETLNILADNRPAESEAPSKDDVAIRDYMERLLQRVGRGTVSASQTSGVEESFDEGNADETESFPDDSMAAATAENGHVVERVPDDEPASAAAPTDRRGFDDHSETTETCHRAEHRDEVSEATTDLLAMRALANVAAKTVIMEFDSKQHAKLAIDKLLVMLVCLPCGMLLLYWYSVHKLGAAYVAASIAFFVVAIWGVQSLRFLGKLLIARLLLARLGRDTGARD